MIDREKVIKALECCLQPAIRKCKECPYESYCYHDSICDIAVHNALALLKEQEVQELTMDEWREWKNNPKRNPICKLWAHDTSPMWALNPDTIHEPALLMGKLKLFTGKPTFEQCKEVKWE